MSASPGLACFDRKVCCGGCLVRFRVSRALLEICFCTYLTIVLVSPGHRRLQEGCNTPGLRRGGGEWGFSKPQQPLGSVVPVPVRVEVPEFERNMSLELDFDRSMMLCESEIGCGDVRACECVFVAHALAECMLRKEATILRCWRALKDRADAYCPGSTGSSPQNGPYRSLFHGTHVLPLLAAAYCASLCHCVGLCFASVAPCFCRCFASVSSAIASILVLFFCQVTDLVR